MSRFAIVAFLAACALCTVSAEEEHREFPGFVYAGTSATRNGGKALSYYYSTTADNFMGALLACNGIGGSLASPMNPVLDNEVRFVFLENQRANQVWLGGRRYSSWLWETKSKPITWHNFQASGACSISSSTGCLTGFQSNGIWSWCGYNCNSNLYYICEFEW